jgi:hypothetical protein
MWLIPAGAQPRHPGHILEATDGTNDDNPFGMPGLIDIEDNNVDKGEDPEPEDDDAELGMCIRISVEIFNQRKNLIARLMKRWDTPVYAFFRPTPAIVYVDGCKVHIFECAASHCKCKTRFIRCYIDTGDISSTNNLCHHATCCWGDEAVAAANKISTAKVAREALSN